MSVVIVALFDNLETASRAVSELRSNHFSDEEISLVTNQAHPEQKQAPGDRGVDAADHAGAGAVIGGLAGLLAGVIVISIPGLGALLALGPLATSLAGAGIGAAAGGLVGALTNAGVPKGDAKVYVEGVRRGNILVSVYTEEDRADLAREIMNMHHPLDLQQKAVEWELRSSWQEGKKTQTFPPEALDRERFHVAQNLGKRGEDTSYIRRIEEGQGTSTPADPSHLPIEEPIGSSQTKLTRSQAFGFTEFEPVYRQHFSETYGVTNEEFDTFRPAYYFGYILALDNRFHDLPWDVLEPEVQRQWEQEYPQNPWNKYQQAVYEGWNEVITRH